MAGPIPSGATYRLQFTCCKKANCGTCHGTDYAHGPYWYAFVHRKDNRPGMASFYVGKQRPAGVSDADAAEARREAERERHRKEAEARAKRRAHEQRKADEHRHAAPGAGRANDWDTIGVRPGASYEEAKRAWRRAAQQHHPDRGGSKERMQDLNAAWDRLRKANRWR